MDTLGMNVSRDDIHEMVAEIDQNGNGDIDFDEFVQVMSRKVHGNHTTNQVKAAFRLFVTDADNETMSVKDLLTALTAHGPGKLTSEEAYALIDQLDLENDRFEYSKYVDMMMK